MLNVDTARDRIIAHCSSIQLESLPFETVPLQHSFQRILAENVFADRDYPPFARSMRDGYAVRARDVQQVPVTLSCVGELRAGEARPLELHDGETVQIMTGAPVPPTADAVVMVESSEQLSPETVRLLKSAHVGDNVAPLGSERKAGDPVLSAGTVVGSLAMAVLATVGKSEVRVVRRPTVSILSTGDELVEVSACPGPAKIRNSNSVSLYSQVIRHGGSPVLIGIASDQIADLKAQVQKGLETDILLVSGGVSAGKYDLVEPVFQDLGIYIHFDAVRMRPGKPTVFATLDSKFVFGLPGNPVSTFVSFELFVAPVLKALQGLPLSSLPLVPAVLEQEIAEKSGRTAFLPARLTRRGREFKVSPVKWRGSADIFSASEANGLIIAPYNTGTLERGTIVEVLVFEQVQSTLEGVF